MGEFCTLLWDPYLVRKISEYRKSRVQSQGGLGEMLCKMLIANS